VRACERERLWLCERALACERERLWLCERALVWLPFCERLRVCVPPWELFGAFAFELEDCEDLWGWLLVSVAMWAIPPWDSAAVVPAG
jgi:hypothetical protein